jgi:hypothetical protein
MQLGRPVLFTRISPRQKRVSPEPTVKTMKAHPGCKPAAWGAVAGAIAIMILGFGWFGWMLGSTAEKMANQRTETAIVAALTPICVEKFQHQAGAAEKLAEFKKISSWDRRSLIEKGGWAIIPGSETSNSAVAAACAEKLGSQT